VRPTHLFRVRVGRAERNPPNRWNL